MQHPSSALGAPLLFKAIVSFWGAPRKALGEGFSRVGVVGTFLPAGVGQKAR